MKVKHIALLLPLLAGVTACTTHPVIADLEEDKVIVQGSANDIAAVQAEARKGCQIHGREPVSISYTCVDRYCSLRRYLFACKPPAQSPLSATAPSSAPTQTTTAANPAGALWDGEWLAQAGPWQLYLKVDNGTFTGRARYTKANPYDVSGQILQDGLVAGRVGSSGGASWGSLSGSFPSVSLVQNGQVQASFELQKKI